MGIIRYRLHARNFLQDWKGKLVCDDFGGYKASFALGVTEIGCMAHARRKFFDLHATNKSTLAEQALRSIQLLYEIESEIRDLEPDLRRRIRQEKAAPVMDRLHAWMIAQRELVHDGVAIAKALDYSLKRWTALSRYLDDGAVPIGYRHDAPLIGTSLFSMGVDEAAAQPVQETCFLLHLFADEEFMPRFSQH